MLIPRVVIPATGRVLHAVQIGRFVAALVATPVWAAGGIVLTGTVSATVSVLCAGLALFVLRQSSVSRSTCFAVAVANETRAPKGNP